MSDPQTEVAEDGAQAQRPPAIMPKTTMAAYHDLRDHGHVHLAPCHLGSESPAESSTDHQT